MNYLIIILHERPRISPTVEQLATVRQHSSTHQLDPEPHTIQWPDTILQTESISSETTWKSFGVDDNRCQTKNMIFFP